MVDTSKIWLSKYTYSPEETVSQHYLTFEAIDGKLVGRSLPDETGSELSLELMEDGKVFTGSWHERTSPTGAYKGMHFHGVFQFILSPEADRLVGKWAGFNSDRTQVNVGSWELIKTADPLQS